ncbi:MAG: AMP-binding protein [Anaerolineaceae bacterium]|nr:AMP-binding protein [Anaerolineaceae bacterium]
MNLPFTNIRQVLSLHNKVSPEKIFLTVISNEGREELSYGEFSARCHQTANFLQEDLGIKPGDVVAIFDDEPADTAVLLTACWFVGAVVAPYGVEWRKEVNNVPVKAQFLRQHDDPEYPMFNYVAQHRLSKDTLSIQIGGKPSSDYPLFNTLVRNMPNSFFNDHAEPILDTAAFFSINYDNSILTVTQGELLTAAETLAYKQAITGNQRLISYFQLSGIQYPHYLVLNIMSVFVAVLLVGGSLTIGIPFEAQAFWREIAASRLHIACLSTDDIIRLIDFARQQKAAGKPIYGEGVYQQDIKQLRHIYCPNGARATDLIKQFTAMFPFPVITNS